RRNGGLRGQELAQAWGQFLGRIPWQSFVSLTFDPKRRFPVDRDLASREACRWCDLVAYATRRPIGWAVAAERGRGGLWHAHALLAGTSVKALDGPVAIWNARNGHAHVQRVQSVTGVAMYSAKDVAHGGEVMVSDTLGRFCSQLAD